jgi:hypothetical protein
MPKPLDRVVERDVGVQANDSCPSLRHLENLGRKTGSDVDAPTGFQFAARRHHRLVRAIADRLEQQDLRGGARRSPSEQSSAKDSGSIDDEHIPRFDELDDVLERSMLDGPGRSIHHHQPTRVALLERLLRDLIPGEIKSRSRMCARRAPRSCR